jgi:hypothetical protein
MAHYTIDETKPLSRILRDGLNSLRNSLFKLTCILGAMNQMSDSENQQAFGFADDTTAANAKAELSSDVGKLTTDASQANVHAALTQMLDQFA